jgi:hypothetical protein
MELFMNIFVSKLNGFFHNVLFRERMRPYSKSKMSFGLMNPGLKMQEHFCYCYCNFVSKYTAQLQFLRIALDAGLQKRKNFSSLIVCRLT